MARRRAIVRPFSRCGGVRPSFGGRTGCDERTMRQSFGAMSSFLTAQPSCPRPSRNAVVGKSSGALLSCRSLLRCPERTTGVAIFPVSRVFRSCRSKKPRGRRRIRRRSLSGESVNEPFCLSVRRGPFRCGRRFSSFLFLFCPEFSRLPILVLKNKEVYLRNRLHDGCVVRATLRVAMPARRVACSGPCRPEERRRGGSDTDPLAFRCRKEWNEKGFLLILTKISIK